MYHTISTQGLSHIASEVCGRAVRVTFIHRRDAAGFCSIDGREISLSRDAIRYRGLSDGCETFLHELGHSLRHVGEPPSPRAEDEANDYMARARGSGGKECFVLSVIRALGPNE